MKCEFSETQFAFSFVWELIRKYPNRFIMPWFPNTVQEGREGGGYDVKIDLNQNISGSLFLQFKIPEYLKSKQKYKIKIETNHNQFRLLKSLKRPANLVYYCTPKFHKEDEIKNFFNSSSIEGNSALFSIEEFPNDGEYHKLIYEYKPEEIKAIESISIVNHNSTEINTYGILSSVPMAISIFSGVFSVNFQTDQMTLIRKAEFILNNVVSKIESIPNINKINDVDWLFSILLLRYNILWIPIK
ncbi:MAG: hypothetical protein JSS07_07190 [Proteobacteria bacterium]|nr:hypothetical protein [Pseudomonadota bacterium]